VLEERPLSGVCLWCARVQSDVYAQLPLHETVPCSSKDLQMPGWMFDEHAMTQRRRQPPASAATTPGSTRGMPAQQPADRRPSPAARKLRTMSAKEAALAAAARRQQDCTFDASPTDRRRSAATSV